MCEERKGRRCEQMPAPILVHLATRQKPVYPPWQRACSQRPSQAARQFPKPPQPIIRSAAQRCDTQDHRTGNHDDQNHFGIHVFTLPRENRRERRAAATVGVTVCEVSQEGGVRYQVPGTSTATRRCANVPVGTAQTAACCGPRFRRGMCIDIFPDRDYEPQTPVRASAPAAVLHTF